MHCLFQEKFVDPSRTFPVYIVVFFLCVLGFVPKVVGQQRETVDFLKVSATVKPLPTEKKVEGTLAYTFKILRDTDSIYLDAHNVKVLNFALEGILVKAGTEKIWLLDDFEAGTTRTAFFTYEARPEQALYFFGNEIWTQGQGKFTSHWLPSIDDVNEKIEFDLTIVAPAGKEVIANGKLLDIKQTPDGTYWQFDMQRPMSSYLVAMAVGPFNKKDLESSSGVPLQLYYAPDDSLKVEPTYRHSKQIFDFLETEIGVPYPWQNYKQVPLRDFLYAGMENTTATFFSRAFMVDSIGFNDRNYINVNAHELAHQWFGDLVTEKSGSDHWLQEGFATYYALLAERKIFGNDYYYWQLYQTAEQLQKESDAGRGESLLDPKASSLTFYQKGAWALHILRERIGDRAFRTAVRNYLGKHKFKNVSTDDFLREVKAVSDFDVDGFAEDWLRQTAFRAEEAYQSLIQSNFIKSYFEVSALRATPLGQKKQALKSALRSNDDFIGQEAVYQLLDEPISETLPLYKIALGSENIYIRQAVALSLQTIPEELQDPYESLLADPSYLTLETALYQLWMQFPQKRKIFLENTKGIIGFQNRNVRQLWLALALITDGYESAEKVNYLTELRDYTAPAYSFEIREKAFQYVNDLQLWDMATLKNLVDACVHPNWRFAKASRELLHQLLQRADYYEQIKVLGRQVPPKAAAYLNKIVKE